jgi:hypothetical protein
LKAMGREGTSMVFGTPGIPLLTMEQLRERWGGISEDVIREHIKRDGLPFVPLGSGGKRPIYRFRLAAVEAWEAAREKALDPRLPPVPPPSVAAMWDGKSRLTGGRHRKSKPFE